MFLIIEDFLKSYLDSLRIYHGQLDICIFIALLFSLSYQSLRERNVSPQMHLSSILSSAHIPSLGLGHDFESRCSAKCVLIKKSVLYENLDHGNSTVGSLCMS